jgi:hypothetical protein
VSGFVIGTLEDVRDMIAWLARRRRTSVTALVASTGMASNALVNFAGVRRESASTRDTNFSLIVKLVYASHHRIVARPIGGKHLQLKLPDMAPLEIRSPGGELLELPVRTSDDLVTLVRTMEAANHCTITALIKRAGVSASITKYVGIPAEQRGELRVRYVLDVVRAGGFELVVQPKFTSRREARLAEESGDR